MSVAIVWTLVFLLFPGTLKVDNIPNIANEQACIEVGNFLTAADKRITAFKCVESALPGK